MKVYAKSTGITLLYLLPGLGVVIGLSFLQYNRVKPSKQKILMQAQAICEKDQTKEGKKENDAKLESLSKSGALLDKKGKLKIEEAITRTLLSERNESCNNIKIEDYAPLKKGISFWRDRCLTCNKKSNAGAKKAATSTAPKMRPKDFDLNPQYRKKVEADVCHASLIIIAYSTILTLFPFIIMGWGIGKRTDLSVMEAMDISFGSVLMKIAIGAIIFTGWIYVFGPFGQITSLLYYYTELNDTTGNTNVTILLDYSRATMTHFVAGFIGWYIYLITYFFYKLYHGDVISNKIYQILFKKMLVIYGASLVLSSMGSTEGKGLVFLLGIFPLSGISLLKHYLVKNINNQDSSISSAPILPEPSRWEIIRLEEEGIEDINALAFSSAFELQKKIPHLKHIEFWINSSRLLLLVGAKKYQELRHTCTYADTFLTKMEKGQAATFKQALSSQHGIHNGEEIASKLLQLQQEYENRSQGTPPNSVDTQRSG